MLVFLPVFIGVSVLAFGRALVMRLTPSGRDAPWKPRFSRPAEMAGAADRSLNDIVEHLERVPYRPLQVPARVAFYTEYGSDGMGVLFSGQHAMSGLPHFYPAAFRPRLFTGADGVRLAGLVAMHQQPAPALVICHGFMTTKNFDYVRKIARRAFEDWGFHVAVFDLRGFGQSLWTGGVPSSCGYKEGLDVLEVARELQQDDLVTSVGALGYSLGGATVLNAARAASEAAADSGSVNPLDGGVLAVSAPTDLREALRYVSLRPKVKDPFFGMWLIWMVAFTWGVREQMGVGDDARSWQDIVEQTSIPFYGVDATQFFNRCSAVTFADQITVPTLCLHARDDFVVPVEHAERLIDAAGDSEHLRVWIVDRGNHGSFTTVDARWYRTVVRRWFEYWAADVRA